MNVMYEMPKITLKQLLKKLMPYAPIDERLRARKKAEELKRIKKDEFRRRVQAKVRIEND